MVNHAPGHSLRLDNCGLLGQTDDVARLRTAGLVQGQVHPTSDIVQAVIAL